MSRRLLLLLALLLGGCSPFRHDPWSPGTPGLHVVSGVPFRAQVGGGDCGPAALASLLAHRGTDVPVGEIASATVIPSLGGSLLPDLENFARKLGYTTRSGRGDLELLRREIARGRPVLIPVETGFWLRTRPHYLVIFGCDRERFLAHAGVEADVSISAANLLPRWERMGRLYLYLE